jgi:hypothetical protein
MGDLRWCIDGIGYRCKYVDKRDRGRVHLIPVFSDSGILISVDQL